MNDLRFPLAKLFTDLTTRRIRHGSVRFGLPSCVAYVGFAHDSTKTVEIVLHELCHWIVATEYERNMFNLGLEGLRAFWREQQALALQVWIEDAIHVELPSALSDGARFELLNGLHPSRLDLNPRNRFRELNAIRAHAAIERLECEHPGALREICRTTLASLPKDSSNRANI